MTAPPACEPTDLDCRLEQFEEAQRRAGHADLAAFLPPAGDRDYVAVLRELVRVDLEYGWARGRPTPLEGYFARFPELAADADARRAIVFEEYRQRHEAGHSPDADEYFRRYGVHPFGPAAEARAAAEDEDGPRTVACAVAAAPAAEVPSAQLRLRSGEALSADEPAQTTRTAPTAGEPALPEAGQVFEGFQLVAELGRGAFGRVFLARQGGLASRPVALKVSAELFGESQTLAQLQHTNIVPIFSVHQVGPLQAVCMPYFGGTTLEDVLRGLRGREHLPTSGHHFVSTLHDRKHSTWRSLPSHGSVPSAAPASVPAAAPAGAAPSAAPTHAAAPPAASEGTTAALETLEHSSFVEAVLWLGARLADGLAHAHERGIIHRDLKPANVLLTDDGQPMLLDFNLSASSHPRGGESGARVGGTLPYMAPEQLRAFRGGPSTAVDGRSDVYALGLILFELLTARAAFPNRRGPGHEVLAALLADRGGSPPRLRPLNPYVTPAVEAIVRKCLEPDPAARYQSAADLQEDLERHLHHLPLKFTREPSLRERAAKWARRHPRLTSSASVATAAAAALVALGLAGYGWREQVETRKAHDLRDQVVAAVDAHGAGLFRMPEAAVAGDFVERAAAALAPYGVLADPAWQQAPPVRRLAPDDRTALREQVGEYLVMLGQRLLDRPGESEDRLRTALVMNDRAGDCFGDASRPALWVRQRQRLLERLGEADRAARVADQFRAAAADTASGHYLAAVAHADAGRFRAAVAELESAVALNPKHFRAHLLLGVCHYHLENREKAAASFFNCVLLRPDHALAHANHGQALFRTGKLGYAYEQFSKAAALDADAAGFRLDKARIAFHLNRHDEALADLNAVLEQPDAPTRAWFLRADVRAKLGDRAGAAADRAEGLRREPADDVSWVTRGFHRMKADAAAALADFRAAEALNPRNFHALQNQAHVLSEHLKRDAEALAVTDRLIALYPDNHQARAGRAVLLARFGRVEDALRDARVCLDGQPLPLIRYQLAGVYARSADQPGHLAQALALLAGALRDGAGWEHLADDPDLDPIRAKDEFRRIQSAAQTLQSFQKRP